MADITDAQATNNTMGIITDEGLSLSIQALQQEGWKIYPRAFSVSETSGLFDNSRTTESMNPTWYEGPISGVIQQSANTIEFRCTIPPGVTASTNFIREIYVTALTENDQLFLLGLGQIDGTVLYNPGGATTLRIIISIQNLNTRGLFEFKYTQATEINDHNYDPNSHSDIRALWTRMPSSILINNNYLAQPGETVFVDSRERAVAVSLPIQDLSLGTRVTVVDIGLASATPGRDIIIRRNGNLIDNREEDFLLDTVGGMVEFFWFPTLQTWRVDIGGRFFESHPDSITTHGTLALSDYIDPGYGITTIYSLDNVTVDAIDNSIVFVDTSKGSATVRLPISPSSGYKIQVVDIKGTAKTNNIIVSGQINNIAASSTTYRIMVDHAVYTFIWEDVNSNWLIDMGGILQVATVTTAGLVQPDGKTITVNNGIITASITDSVLPTRKINTTSPLTGGGDLSADRTLSINAASTSATGAVQLATLTETSAGTLATKAVTPAGLTSALSNYTVTTRKINTTAPLTGGGDLSADRTLAISAASTSATGAVQLATTAEAAAGTNATKAVTPAALKAAIPGSVPPTRIINTTAPLTGGGTLADDRTLAISAASTSATGAVQLATTAEATTGTNATKAVTPAGLKTVADTKVTKTGDTMTGNLYVGASGTNRVTIQTTGAVLGSQLYVDKPVLDDTSHYAYISFRTTRQDGTLNNRQHQIRSISEKSTAAVGTSDDPSFMIEGRGMLFAGSGESASSMRNVLVTGVTEVPAGLQRVWNYAGVYNDATEHTVISSDNYLYLITNCNTIANAKGAYLGPDGSFFPHLAVGQSLGSSSARWDAYIRNLNVTGTVTGVVNTPSSTGSTGYTTLVSGVIIQWGLTSALGSTTVTVTFPYTFPSACRAVFTQRYGGGTRFESRVTSFSTSAATLVHAGVNNESGSNNIYWLALGV